MLLDDEVEDLGTEEEEDGRSDWCSLLSLLFPFLSLPRIPVTLALVPQRHVFRLVRDIFLILKECESHEQKRVAMETLHRQPVDQPVESAGTAPMAKLSIELASPG